MKLMEVDRAPNVSFIVNPKYGGGGGKVPKAETWVTLSVRVIPHGATLNSSNTQTNKELPPAYVFH